MTRGHYDPETMVGRKPSGREGRGFYSVSISHRTSRIASFQRTDWEWALLKAGRNLPANSLSLIHIPERIAPK